MLMPYYFTHSIVREMDSCLSQGHEREVKGNGSCLNLNSSYHFLFRENNHYANPTFSPDALRTGVTTNHREKF